MDLYLLHFHLIQYTCDNVQEKFNERVISQETEDLLSNIKRRPLRVFHHIINFETNRVQELRRVGYLEQLLVRLLDFFDFAFVTLFTFNNKNKTIVVWFCYIIREYYLVYLWKGICHQDFFWLYPKGKGEVWEYWIPLLSVLVKIRILVEDLRG